MRVETRNSIHLLLIKTPPKGGVSVSKQSVSEQDDNLPGLFAILFNTD
jgi:hypothetical protein